jgi:hypothetical protein
MAEALRLGLDVRPPHVNFSAAAFSLVDGSVLYMGLGQVRDLRRSAVEALLAARAQRPIAGLRDLVARVPLRVKEVDHLIRCGALDGLAASRAALLDEAGEIGQHGSGQLAFAFARPRVPAETTRQRWDWEAELLGLPVSAFADPLALVCAQLPAHVPLAELPTTGGRPVLTAGVRLPGWTGGPGFFLGDGQTFVIARGDKAAKAPAPWLPLRVQGRWASDGWGSSWLQIDRIEATNDTNR